MFKSILLSSASLLLLATPIHAVCGIHTFGHCEDMITHWYDPQTGEICDPLDCGGGRAPPKTDVPGCGTIPLPPYTASYLSCWTPGFTGAPGPATVVQQSTAETTAETVPEKTTAAVVISGSESTSAAGESLTKETTAVAAPSSSSEESAKGSSTVATTKASSSPETTAPAVLPVLPSTARTGAANGTVTSSSVTSAAPTADDKGAAVAVKGSVMAVLGAVAAVVVMV